MIRTVQAAVLGVMLAGTIAGGSFAQERTDVLASSGAWAALAIRSSLTAPPSVCVAANVLSGVIVRIDEMTIELRISDNSWSLPSSVEGMIKVSVAGASHSFEVSANTVTTVAARLSRDQVLSLLDAMDKAPSMAVTVGNAKPFTASLVGSTISTNALRTCAGLKGSQATPPSANPFR